MKKRYWILIGALLGFAANFALFAYGDNVLDSAKEEFAAAIKNNAGAVIYKAPKSESKIAVLWAEQEKMPWKEAITVRVGSPKEKNVRVITFKKQ